MDFFLVEKLTVARLHQRCEETGEGEFRFRLDRETVVAVSRAEWNEIGGWFRATVAPSARLLRGAIVLQIPAAIALLALVLNIAVLRQAADAVDGRLAGLAWLLLSISLPLVAAAHHNRIVAAALRTVMEDMEQRPRIAVATSPRTGWHALEIVALILFGPGAFVDLYGSLAPHAFDHTPWMGRQLGWSSVAGLAAFAAIFLFRARRRARAG